MYHCFKHTIPEDKLTPRILQVLLDIQERKESLLMKEKNKLSSTMESVKKSISPFISSNKEQFSGLTNQIETQLTGLTDDSIDDVAEQCHKAIETFTSNENKDLSQIIGDMLSTDSDKVKETMEKVGLGEDNIKALVGSVSDGLPNDKLKSTIPSFEDIDAIINGTK
jgi:formate dehydrogenase maturation protein FdhE